MQISTEMISGQTQSHLANLTEICQLHVDVIDPFRVMQSAAAQEGIDLQVASGFRSYERQLAIWNAKASGTRVLLDGQGQCLNIESLNDVEKVYAILRWSALPGCSRHHWGTDMDVWDAAAVAEDYQLQLVPEEYQPDGPFHKLACWLDQYAESYGFVRPYAIDGGGVAPEPWHLSYQPIARQYEVQLNTTFVKKILDNASLMLSDVVKNNLDDILERFIYPASLR